MYEKMTTPVEASREERKKSAVGRIDEAHEASTMHLEVISLVAHGPDLCPAQKKDVDGPVCV